MKSYSVSSIVLGVFLTAASAQSYAQVAAPPVPDVPAAAAAAAPMVEKAAMKAKKKMVKPVKLPTVVVAIANNRAVALTSLDAMPAGGGDVVPLASALGAGKKTTAKVPHDKACLFDLHGAFEDGSTTDVQAMNLCKDKKINLVE